MSWSKRCLTNVSGLKTAYTKIIQLGINPDSLDIEAQERVITTNQISALLFIIAFPYAFIFSLVSPKLGLPVSILECFFAAVLFLNKFNYHKTAKIILILTANLGAFCYAFILGVASGVHLLLIAFAGLSLIIFKPTEKKGIQFGIFLPILLQVIIQFIPNQFIQFNVSTHYLTLINKTAVFAVTAIIILYIFFFSKVTLDYANKLLEKNKDLENLVDSERKLRLQSELQTKELEAKAMIDKELVMAQDIQKNILPKHSPSTQNYAIDHLFIPARQVSGDYFDFFPLSATKIGIVIADIIGKGIPASLMMIAFKGLMHQAVSPKSSPSQTLAQLGDAVYFNQILGKYVPAFYGILDTRANTFTYANAGHETGWIFKKDGEKALSVGGYPLGMFETQFYEEETIDIDMDDQILLFTDGLTDIENSSKQKLGIDALKTMLKTLPKDENHPFRDRLKRQIVAYAGKQKQCDDMTLIRIERTHCQPLF